MRTTRRVADGRLDISQAAAARIATPVSWGTYRLDVRAPDLGATAQTSITFTVGWSGDQSAETPDLLEMNLDKASYRAGDSLQIRLRPGSPARRRSPSSATRCTSCASSTCRRRHEREIPVRPEWGAGAYPVAFAHRPLDQAAKRLPGRALGLAWFEVDREAHACRSHSTPRRRSARAARFDCRSRSAGLNAGEEARLTVAAVDVGILNLTRYCRRMPEDHFFGQQQLSTEIRDLYGYLIDGMQGTRGAIRSGGDEDGAELEGSPPTQEPLALFSGIVRVGAGRHRRRQLRHSRLQRHGADHGGRLDEGPRRRRRRRHGHPRSGRARRRRLPRFLRSATQSRLFTADRQCRRTGGRICRRSRHPRADHRSCRRLRSTLRLERKGARRRHHSGHGGRSRHGDHRRRDSRAAASRERSRFALRIQPGSSALLDRDGAPARSRRELTRSSDLSPTSCRAPARSSLSVSPLASPRRAGPAAAPWTAILMAARSRSSAAPCRCSMSTGSRPRTPRPSTRSADERVREAIERVLSRQDSQRLVRPVVGRRRRYLARRLCHRLPDPRARARLCRAAARLQRSPSTVCATSLANTTKVEENGGEARLCGLCARPQRPAGDGRSALSRRYQVERLRHAARARPDRRGARAPRRSRARADRVRGGGRSGLRADSDRGSYRDDYGSRLRDGAGLMALGLRSGRSARADKLIGNVIETETRTRAHDEHAGECLDGARRAGAPARRGIDRASVDGTAHRGALLPDDQGHGSFAEERTTIANTGAPPVSVVVSVTGNPIGPEPPLSRRLCVERSYYRLDGTPADVARVRQNDRFVTVLKVTENVAQAARLLLVDRLPAGLEIDNPQLVDTDTFEALSWLKTGRRTDARGISRRPLRRGARPRAGPAGDLHGCLHRPRGRAGRATCIRPQPSRTCIGRSGSGAPPRASSKSRRGREGVDGNARSALAQAAHRRRSRRCGRDRRGVRRRRPSRRRVGTPRRFGGRPLSRPSSSTVTAGCCAPSSAKRAAGDCRRRRAMSTRAFWRC